MSDEIELTEGQSAVRRFSATGVLDTSNLMRYYNRRNIFVSFTDTGDFIYDLPNSDIKHGIVSYPVNDVIGRRARDTTLYGRVFRLDYKNTPHLLVSQYRQAMLESDKKRIRNFLTDVRATREFDGEFHQGQIDVIFSNASMKATDGGFFGQLWFIVNEISNNHHYDVSADQLFIQLGYSVIYDDTGRGVIVSRNTPVLLMFDESEVQNLEITSIQKFKKEQNSYMKFRIDRFNSLTKVSNARRRIVMWGN